MSEAPRLRVPGTETKPVTASQDEAQQQHVPVLLEECLQYLNVRPGGVFVDATLGLGGHSAAIARRLGGAGKLICFDRDLEAMVKARQRLEALAAELGPEMPTVIYEPRAFSEAAVAIAPGSLDGLLADFGVSSLQLDEPHRRRGSSRRPDLRIRRGREVAENRQSHCAGPADHYNSRTGSSGGGRGPFNEGRQDTPRNKDFSGHTDSSE